MGPGSRVKSEAELQELDTNPSDKQPPGVDEKENEWEPQSLEEALLGEWEEGEHLRVGLPFHWLWPSKEDTLSRLDGGKDHDIWISRKQFSAEETI
mgnify:CR=1 FL=1